jgi:regulator of protease activity HflC (stomatin/prohibitin superfamily)
VLFITGKDTVMSFDFDDSEGTFERLREKAGSALVWVAIAFLFIAAALFYTVRVGHVSGEEVGVLLNRITGKMTVVEQSGARIYNGFTHDFFVLDKTLQTLEMSQDATRGDRKEQDDLKIKTVDGSDVFVDLKVQYRIIPDMAIEVLQTSGIGDRYKEKWTRDYVRSLARNYLGELTTEDFYDSAKRDEKVADCVAKANELLEPFGLHVDSIAIPIEPHFYAEYEEMIKRKKLADQAVLEEQSKALAAKQRQETAIVTETNKKNVAEEEFSGQMEQKKIKAKAEAEKVQKDADAYYNETTITAEAVQYEMEKQAEGILEQKEKEAEGLRQLISALQGPGGRNMVKLEYAKRLTDMTFDGQPYLIDSETARLQHTYTPDARGDGRPPVTPRVEKNK